MDYKELDRRCRSIGLDTGASESHGIYCGLLCGGHQEAETAWLSELLSQHDSQDLLVRECAEGLHDLAEETRADIDGPGLGFSPCLPLDETPMSERAPALRDWCRGFLYGLGLSGTHDEHLSPASLEALGDLSNIVQLDEESLSDSEQEEEAYTELAEFVWVAAMLVYEERARLKEPA